MSDGCDVLKRTKKKWRDEIMATREQLEIFAANNIDDIMVVAEEQMFGMGNGGFCIACGAEIEGCEPDMVKGPCECCGERQVYGAQELVLYY